jgi:outer membrane protein TolC
VQLSAKATYQSEVTEIPIDFSKLGLPIEIPSLDKDQYGASLDLSQTLWDGGAAAAKKKGIRARAEADEKEVEVSLYAVRERINQLFFGILLCDAMIEQNRLFRNELQINHERVENLIRSGLANQSDLAVVRVEQLKAEQALTQILYGRKTYLNMLSAFIGEKLEDSVRLQKPDSLNLTGLGDLLGLESARPEISLFDANLANLVASKSELNATLMPKLGLFLTGGYGKPGLNMLKNEFSAYYIGGVRMTWNFGAFYTRKNSLRQIETNRNAIEVQRETFLFNTALSQTGKENEISKFRDLLRSDDEIVELRSSVKKASEIRLENGTLNAADLMRDITAEQLARQERTVHEIEMLQAIYNLKFITNK